MVAELTSKSGEGFTELAVRKALAVMLARQEIDFRSAGKLIFRSR